jgi:phosphoserine phosphatase
MRAHVFDMDGTLLHGTTASVLLAAALGRPDSLDVLEERFAAGALTTVEFVASRFPRTADVRSTRPRS